MKTFRLSSAQVRRAYLLEQLAAADWHLDRTAERMRGRGYLIDGVTNAARMDYTRTTIMYRPGFGGEAARLARDLKVPLVGPLDGMRPADLGSAQLVVIVGP